MRWASGQLLAIALLGVAWYQASNALTVGSQISWSCVGVAGIGVSLASNGTWLYRGHRSVALVRHALSSTVASRVVVRRPPDREGSVSSPTRFVSGARMSRYHRGDCAFVVDRALQIASRERHESTGRHPCEVCLGDADAHDAGRHDADTIDADLEVVDV